MGRGKLAEPSNAMMHTPPPTSSDLVGNLYNGLPLFPISPPQ